MVRCANTPPLQVRPTATARWPTRGSSAVARGRHAEAGDADDREARRQGCGPSTAPSSVCAVSTPDGDDVVVQVRGRCDDQILGHDDAGHRPAVPVHLNDRGGGLLGGVRELGRESRENVASCDTR